MEGFEMSYNFHVGQQVAYIFKGRRRLTLKDGEAAPVAGRIYTIRGFHPSGDSIVLEEIKNPRLRYCPIHGEMFEPHWFLTSFRPLIKTDISIFQAMLVPTDKRIDA
jgi:hypothetical protein